MGTSPVQRLLRLFDTAADLLWIALRLILLLCMLPARLFTGRARIHAAAQSIASLHLSSTAKRLLLILFLVCIAVFCLFRKPLILSLGGTVSVTASYYERGFIGKPTANGEIFTSREPTAAHRFLPFHTQVTLTNPQNGRTVRVRINDRGPFVKGRDLDLSREAAERLITSEKLRTF